MINQSLFSVWSRTLVFSALMSGGVLFSSSAHAQIETPTLIKPESSQGIDGEPRPEPKTGPVVEDLGPVYFMTGDFMNLSRRGEHKAVMDVAADGGFDLAMNPSFESAARYLNMHVQHGIDLKNLKLSLVVHGKATKDTLTDEVYRDQFGVNNPNTALLASLNAAGVQVLVCGQSLLHNGYAVEDLNSTVQPALSAMTAHVILQEDGYSLIPF